MKIKIIKKMKEEEKMRDKIQQMAAKPWLRLLLAFFFILAVGILVEILYNLPIHKQEDYNYLDSSQIEADGFQLEDGIYVSQKAGAKLTLTFDTEFVDKLYYQYSCEGQLYTEIEVGDYSEENSSKARKFTDKNIASAGTSTVNIHRETNKITLTMPDNVEHVNIQAIAINNTGNFSLGRFLFSCIAAALFLMIASLIYKKRQEKEPKAEWIFLTIAFSVGLLMIITLPTHKVGMDEEIHFGRAYYLFDMFSGKDTVTVTPAMNDLITVSLNNWPEDIPQSEEEASQEGAYWNSLLSWDSQSQDLAEYQQNNYSFHLYSFCYLNQAVMIKAGQLLHLPFTDIYRLGRLGNLLLYCLVIFFAIRHIPYGKRIMMVLALSPLGMFSAVTYTYDTTVIAFTFLGLAYLLPELIDDGGHLTKKNALIFVLAFLIASLPKPVYIPMILMALLIPESRFANRKQAAIFKGVIFVAFLLMLSTFALEPIFNANQAGDSRGGDTGVGRQLRYIFSHPFTYAKLLIQNVWERFMSFTFGYQGLGRMGHLEGNQEMVAPGILLACVALTDHRKEQLRDLKPLQRISGILCCGIILALITTAMYLSFTPVRADIIRGVQGRYYLPVTILGLLALRPAFIENHLNKRQDLALVSGASAAILLINVYTCIIRWTF